MTKWHRLQELLSAAKHDAADNPALSKTADNPALSKTIEAVQIIADELMAKERREADARISPRAVRHVSKN